MGVRNGRSGKALSSASVSISLKGTKGESKHDFWPVIDFFSGCGGMSFGFARRPPFKVIAAVDAEHAKPCEGFGSLDCNATYRANIGIEPFDIDMEHLEIDSLLSGSGAGGSEAPANGGLTALLCCPPCTDFSRAKPTNHLTDSSQNLLVISVLSS